MKNSQRYFLKEKITVGSLPKNFRRLDVWIPTLLDEPQQRVESMVIKTDLAFDYLHDTEHGNPILHTTITTPGEEALEIELEYKVVRGGYPQEWPQAEAGNPTAGERYAYLRPERHVNVDQKTLTMAADVVGDEKDPVKQLRKLYDHVVGFMSYDANQQSWKGSTEHALTCQIGNCNDIHALFTSLARSLGIPSRMVMGVALEEPADGEEECDVCGYHCWAEAWVPGLGWFPADASCATKYSKHQLFGDIEINHIAYSRGRDILLAPAQRGDRLLYFATPYAEVDGIAHRPANRTLTFKKLD